MEMDKPIGGEDTLVVPILGDRYRPAVHPVHHLLHVQHRIVHIGDKHRPIHHIADGTTRDTTLQPFEQVGAPQHPDDPALIGNHQIAWTTAQGECERLVSAYSPHIPE